MILVENTLVITDSTTFTNLEFVTEEVLSSEEKRVQRGDDLYLSMILGNNYNRQVQLKVETTEGVRQIDGSVMAITGENILLKGSIRIPIYCISEVKVY